MEMGLSYQFKIWHESNENVMHLGYHPVTMEPNTMLFYPNGRCKHAIDSVHDLI